MQRIVGYYSFFFWNRPKQYRKINNNRYVTKHSNRDLLDLLESELNLNIFVLFEGKANEIYSAVG